MRSHIRMPLKYTIDPNEALVTITGDYAEPEEWRDLLGAIARDPALRPGFGFLRDLRGSAHPVSVDAVTGIVAVVREFWRTLGARRAAILTRPAIDIPATIAHALAEDQQLPLRAFNAYEDAVEYLKRG